LLESTINCVLEDDFGYLWLSGMQGIYRVERAQLNAVAERRAHTVQCLALGVADGMENPESNGGENQPAGWKGKDGRLWFPTKWGVVTFEPKSIPLHETPPQVIVEQVKADDELVSGDAVLSDLIPGVGPSLPDSKAKESPSTGSNTLRYGGNSTRRLSPGHGHFVEFKYTANSFVDPELVRFKYRLKGADLDWRDETHQRSASYFNLRPGNYRFEVIAANHHNVWSPVPAVFPFTLEPHFWQTGPFFLACAVGLLVLVMAIQGYRLRWQHRVHKLEQQRVLAYERTRIARDLHDDLGTALTGLALELDVVGREAGAARPVSDRLSVTAQRTRDLVERMREVVWTVNPSCDTVSSLASFLEQQVSQFLRVDGLRAHLEFPENIPDLPMGAEARHQLALSVREALTNVVRHSHASQVWVSLELMQHIHDHGKPAPSGSLLIIRIKDNGRGFLPANQTGHGLDNMKARMERVHGRFECASISDAGTTITLSLPLADLTV
jgi:two-component sensor histidine kinase